MSEDDPDLIHGGGNIFRDLGDQNADHEPLRALLAARIIGVLDDQRLTVRAAQEITSLSAADSLPSRNAKLGRFTIDRLMSILDALGREVGVTVNVHPRHSNPQPVTSPANARPSAQR